ncbi:RNA polymerase sigma factor [Streptomyces sp. NBC_01497]|uniref:RNA polymerase sigma factor n=1 Tax=Streptomyces sp. NBC_01497 TaxID=2903885 RepID=UPI002E303D29|nr:sigma-70 family RNA polymerase sigma factor [Streptomyces sp. NBC_01497]
MASDVEAQFTDVYREHYEDVLRFVRRRAHPMYVDDIVSDTFLTAWRRWRELPEEPRPWLFGTARKVMLNAHRGQHRQTAVAVRIMEVGGDDSYDGMIAAENRMDLVSAWRQLSAADQEVLALHVWEGLPDRAAASVLGCSRAAYTMRLSRCKRRLAKAFGSTSCPAPILTSAN